MPAESLRQRAVASVAAKIQERMGPLVGSPEYLADPVKRARSEKRQRDAAEAYAEFAIESALSEILPVIREAGEGLEPFKLFAEGFVEGDGWSGPMSKTRIIDWFGPSDFVRAAAIHAKIMEMIDAEG